MLKWPFTLGRGLGIARVRPERRKTQEIDVILALRAELTLPPLRRRGHGYLQEGRRKSRAEHRWRRIAQCRPRGQRPFHPGTGPVTWRADRKGRLLRSRQHARPSLVEMVCARLAEKVGMTAKMPLAERAKRSKG